MEIVSKPHLVRLRSYEVVSKYPASVSNASLEIGSYLIACESKGINDTLNSKISNGVTTVGTRSSTKIIFHLFYSGFSARPLFCI